MLFSVVLTYCLVFTAIYQAKNHLPKASNFAYTHTNIQK